MPLGQRPLMSNALSGTPVWVLRVIVVLPAAIRRSLRLAGGTSRRGHFQGVIRRVLPLGGALKGDVQLGVASDG
jgi:hypothetical protein